MRLNIVLVMLIYMWSAQGSAAQDVYKITDTEKAACASDAIRFCMWTYPSESRLLTCMKTNRTSLSPTCLAVFDAGIRRRGL